MPYTDYVETEIRKFLINRPSHFFSIGMENGLAWVVLRVHVYPLDNFGHTTLVVNQYKAETVAKALELSIASFGVEAE